ncbi:hypothetical protein [Hasllibacter sp. MH4015]|uniref:hypothetical protein n=1 Tax=Hasllibacter sp. MH4015 TaxID=2854029 RepID=UPI001CD694E0|nr:hypothetical protein [Hasllibacter sp. MH4015]
MTKAPFLAAAITLAATLPGFAQSELDRLAAATEAAGANMETFLVSQAPSLADVMPDWTWSPEMRDAAACTLDAIRDEGGDAAVADYITQMEAFAETEITSLEQVAQATPVPISADFAAATGQACGTAELAMQQMQDSGLMAAMMDPAVMMQLMGQ